MINIETIKKLEDEAIEKRVEDYRKKEKNDAIYYENSLRTTIILAEKGKLIAEKQFPDRMRKLEERIKEAIIQKRRAIIYEIWKTDTNLSDEAKRIGEFEINYTKVMFMSVLPLEGLICKINGDSNIEVSW